MPSFDEHLSEPDITIDQYVRRTQIALGQTLTRRRAVYLDTKFWILLRDADRNAGTLKNAELLDMLRRGVAEHVLFCPISESTFVELMKQSDPASRLATATLIDELSLSTTLLQEDMRISTEIAHLMYANSGHTNLHPLEHLVWCKLSYVLGIMHPTNTMFDSATERAIQKSFFDHMWTISLSEMITIIGDGEMPGTDLSNIATTLNMGIAAHANELRSFKQSYAAEARGIVDLVGNTTIDVMMSMARDRGITLAQPTPEERRKSENGFKNLLAFALEHEKAHETLRTMHILASLHASLRWNKGRKFKGNDLFDFHHAAAALAYCDAFFTEKSLGTMVTQSNLSLSKLYNCHVVADVEEAINWLLSLD